GGFFEILGSPQAVPLEHRDGVLLDCGLPKELIETAKWPGYAESISDSARFIGFGQSFLRGEEPDNLKQPVHLRCPESIMGEKVDYRLDLWHTGCFEHDWVCGTLTNGVGVKAREQTSALEKAQATENHRTTDLAATEDTHAEAPTSADAVASVQEGPVGEEYEAKGVSIQVPRLKDAFVKKASDPTMARLLPIIDWLLRFRPSDRLPLHAQTTPTDSSRRGFIDDYPLEIPTQREQELLNSSEQPHPEITAVQEASERPQLENPEGASGLPGNYEQQQLPDQDEVTNSPDEQGHQPQDLSHVSQRPRQVQPEAPAGSSEPLSNDELQQSQVLEVSRSSAAETAQSEAQTGTLDMSSDTRGHRPVSPNISKNLEQGQLEAADEASDLLHNQEEPQPEASDACQGSNKAQSEVQTGALDMSSDTRGHRPASPDISKNLGQEQLEAADETPGLLQSQGEPQPESEIPESPKQSQLGTMEDAAESSEGSQPQEPGGRKRLRSRLEGLLNHGWRPWKRRRNS
ncbi:hypothetical protein N7530_001031, partial [Penicillium desertorum]